MIPYQGKCKEIYIYSIQSRLHKKRNLESGVRTTSLAVPVSNQPVQGVSVTTFHIQ
jgi:hypothetical protein